MLSVGLIGLGRHGRRYADHLVRGDVAGARLGGFWRRDEGRAAEDARALGVPYQPTMEALVLSVDVVVAAIPAGEHLTIAELAGRAGRPLLLEKPLAPSAREGRAIIDACEGRLMVAQTLRFDPLTVQLKRAIEDLGALRGFGLEQRLEPRGLAWENTRSAAGGGVLLQTGIHGIDALTFITGAPPTLERATLDHVLGNETEDQAWLSLWARGVRGDLRTSKIGIGRRHRYAFFCERGIVEADYVERVLAAGDARTAVPQVPTVARTLVAFVEWVRGEREACPVPPEEALGAVEVVEAAYAQYSGGMST